jgi:phage shock protein A
VAYQQQLEMLTRVRSAVAEVATSRKRLELQAGQLGQQIDKVGDRSRKAMEVGGGDQAEETGARRDAAQERLADLRHQYADVQAEEECVSVQPAGKHHDGGDRGARQR